ncbi:MAG: hypothetical protein WCC52_02940 [Nitrosotalea sp.]
MSQIIELKCPGCGNEFIGFHSIPCMICGCDAFPKKTRRKIKT